MKAYVAHLMALPQSVLVADRCVETCERFGIECFKWPATPKQVVQAALREEKLEVAAFSTKFSDPDAVVANFITQYRLWGEIVENDIPAIIFEHDAVMVAPLPKRMEFEHVLQIGRPSFGKFVEQRSPGVYPLYSKPGGYFPGAHAYIVHPSGAALLRAAAKAKGAQPCDLFLSLKNFPWLQELWPWVAEAHDDFSTIQKKQGCLAKHRFKQGYEHL